MKKLYKKYFGEFLLVLSAFSYTFEWLFIRNLFDAGYTGLEITFAKAFFAVVILFVFLFFFQPKTLQFKLKQSLWLYLLLIGIIGFFSNVAFNDAIQNTSVANVLVIVYFSIFWTFFFGVFFLKEHFSYRKMFYTILAFLGILMVVAKGINFVDLQFGKGEWLAFFVSFLMALNVIIQKHISQISALFRVFIVFVIIAFFAFCSIVSQSGFFYFAKFFQPDFLISGFLLAFSSGVLGVGFKNLGIKYVPVSIVLVILLLEPILQTTTAYFFAEETISFLNFLGMILVFAMVILISRSKKEKEIKIDLS